MQLLLLEHLKQQQHAGTAPAAHAAAALQHPELAAGLASYQELTGKLKSSWGEGDQFNRFDHCPKHLFEHPSSFLIKYVFQNHSRITCLQFYNWQVCDLHHQMKNKTGRGKSCKENSQKSKNYIFQAAPFICKKRCIWRVRACF